MVVLTICLGLPMHAETHRISVEQITDFLELEPQSASVSVPTVVSRIDRPALRVLAQARRGNSLRLRLGCANRECLPFYVRVDFDNTDAANRFSLPRATLPPQGRKVVAAIVRSGTRARLEASVRGVRVQLFVTCLQAGIEGDVIRARDEVTKRIYNARVIDKGHLRSEL